jgi:hypothetical protein
MKCLIISDEPEQVSFNQILKLETDIKKMVKKQVDLVTFSRNGVFLNGKLIKSGTRPEMHDVVKQILKKMRYSLFVISLESNNLEQLLSNESNLIELIYATSPNATVFIFGASRMLEKISPKEKVFLYPRVGVSKLTKEFRAAVLSHVEK